MLTVDSSQGFSDHFIIHFTSPFVLRSTFKSKPGYVFDFTRANYSAICSFLLDFDFSYIYVSLDIEYVWCEIKSLIFHAMSLFIPKT